MPGTHGQLMKKGVNFSGSAEGGGGSDIQEVDYAVFEQKSQAEKDNGTVWFVYNIPSFPDGKVAEPNNVQTWLNCANITDKSYTTVNEVLADTTTLTALISSNNASDYMARSTTWATTICANQTAMTLIGANNYCADAVLADSTWLEAVANSAYMESVLNVKVPTMTSNTTPSGEASCYGNPYYPAYYAFDNNDDTRWGYNVTSGVEWIVYKFTKSFTPLVMEMYPITGGYLWDNTDDTFQGSNDGTNFVTLVTKNDIVSRKTIIPYSHNKYSHYKWNLQTLSSGQIYGREDV